MYNIIIPLAETHVEQIKRSLPFIRKNLKHKKIIIFFDSDSKKMEELRKVTMEYKDVYIKDENSLGNLNLANIILCIKKRGGDVKRAGWYFQQFIKMEYSLCCDDQYYLVWDADTIPLKKINFLDDGVCLFNPKTEYHEPYFKIMSRLLKTNIGYPGYSFISEGMIFNTEIMKELIEIIDKTEYPGAIWYEKILNAIDRQNLNHSGFSEFELYGNFSLLKKDGKMRKRALYTERHGMKKYGKLMSPEELAKLPYDTISFEIWDKGIKMSILSLLKKFQRSSNDK